MFKQNIKLLITLVLTTALCACGSSDDDDTTPQPEPTTPPTPTPTPTAMIGVFLDSPVIGIGYRTETLSGVTNDAGEYDFLEGETVTFFIGGLEFPATAASGVVTPLNIAQTENVTDSSVVNMARLLQTLDQDGDPSNGITITQTAIDTAEPVDFSQSTSDFSASAAVQSTIENGGQDTPVTALIDESDALDHLAEELRDNDVQVGIVGTWNAVDDENELLTLIFFNDGSYVHLEVDRQDDEEISGMEWGSYTRDTETGRIQPTQDFDENGDTGLTDFTMDESAPRLFARVEDGELNADVDENADGTVDETLTFTKLPNDNEVGTWLVRDRNGTDQDENDLLMFVFYSDGTYVHAEVDFSDSEEDSGMEWGTYSINAETNKVSVTQTFDANGDTGLTDFTTDPDLGLFISVSENVMTLSVDENGDGVIEETLNFDRI